MSIAANPILPVWAIVMICLALLTALSYGTRLLLQKNIPRKWVMILGLIRLAAFCLFLLCLVRPEVSYVRTIMQDPDLAVMVDVSRSMAVLCPSEQVSRLDKAIDILRSGRLQSEYLNHFNVYWFAFDQNARPVDESDLGYLEPEGKTTCYAESLSTAWSFYRQVKSRDSASSTQSGRILFVSDGNDRGTRDVIEEALRLGAAIDTMAPSVSDTDNAETNVTIVSVQSPGRVLLGSESRFLITVRHTGASEQPLTLTLAEDGKPILNYDFMFAAHEQERYVSLTHHPTSIGIKQYTVQVAPRNSSAAVQPSSSYSLSVKVESEKNEVLFLEDSWRWEFKFLRRVFENDPNFSFTGFISRGPGIFMQFGEPGRRVNLAGYPQTRAELAVFDTFVLGDVDPSHWPRALAPAIYDLVVEEGKSLIVIAGPSIAKLARVPEIDSLLPVEITPASAKPVEGPVEERISLEGTVSPLFFRPPDESGAKRWPNLPPMDQVYPPLRKRPAATILLEAKGRANDYGNLIVAAEHTVGRGRVLFIGTDTLWKWQMIASSDKDGNTPYSFFWQQALRALKPQRLTAGNVRLWVQTDRSKYKSGQIVSLRAEIESDKPLDRPVVDANVTLPDERNLPIVFLQHATEPNVFVAEFGASTPGQYKINASVSYDDKTAADTVTAIDVQKPETEVGGAAIDEANLAQIAAVTGGKLIDPDDPKSWPDFSRLKEIPVQQSRTIDFWHGFWLLIFLVVVLGLDWLIRLARGYV